MEKLAPVFRIQVADCRERPLHIVDVIFFGAGEIAAPACGSLVLDGFRLVRICGHVLTYHLSWGATETVFVTKVRARIERSFACLGRNRHHAKDLKRLIQVSTAMSGGAIIRPPS